MDEIFPKRWKLGYPSGSQSALGCQPAMRSSKNHCFSTRFQWFLTWKCEKYLKTRKKSDNGSKKYFDELVSAANWSNYMTFNFSRLFQLFPGMEARLTYLIDVANVNGWKCDVFKRGNCGLNCCNSSGVRKLNKEQKRVRIKLCLYFNQGIFCAEFSLVQYVC